MKIIDFIDDLKGAKLPINLTDFCGEMKDIKKDFCSEYIEKYILQFMAPEDMDNLVYEEDRMLFSFGNHETIVNGVTEVLERFSYKFHGDPEFVLFYGFFSPDGFILPVKDKWYPALGLDRFQDLFRIQAVAAHELGHYILKASDMDYDQDKKEIFANYLSTVIMDVCYNKVIFSEGKQIPMISNEDRDILMSDLLKIGILKNI